MVIRGLMVLLGVGGFMLWFMAKIDPFIAMLGMDFVGVFMMFVPVIICFIQVSRTRTTLQFDPPSGGMTAIINYIRRDGNIIPLVGNRVYSGESFLDIPRMGLIEDLGKDTVFNWGIRRTRLGLENINYTPDPRYFNLTAEFYRLGFDNSDDLWNVLNVSSISDKDMKAYYLEYMGRVYQNMLVKPKRGGQRLVSELKNNKPSRKQGFKPKNQKKMFSIRLNKKHVSSGSKPVLNRNIEGLGSSVSNFNNPAQTNPYTQMTNKPSFKNNVQDNVYDDIDRVIKNRR